MKRRIALLLTLALAFTAATFMRSDSVTSAQNQTKMVFDTGLLTPGPNQKVRVSFSAGGDSGSLILTKLSYLSQTCDAHDVCMTSVASQESAGPYHLDAAQAIVIDATSEGYATRIIARTNIKNVTVTVEIIDTITGNIESFTAPGVPPGTY